MDIAELRKLEHLSVSGINDYLDCGLLYRFSRVEKRQPEFVSDALVLGTVIHKVLANYHQERMTGNRLSLKALKDHFKEEWSKAAQDNPRIQYKNGNDYDSGLNEGKTLIRAYYDSYIEETPYQVLAIEEPFLFTVQGLDIPVIGVIDMIEEDDSGTIVITDFKTTGRAYSADEVNQNFQLTIYLMAAKANGFKEREILLKFDCLVKTKAARFERYYTAREKSDESRALGKVMAVANAIRKGVFIPHDGGWKCKGCAYQRACVDWAEYPVSLPFATESSLPLARLAKNE